MIPKYILEALTGWEKQGLYPGEFLAALLQNDLKTTVMHADRLNGEIELIGAIVTHCRGHLHRACWGDSFTFNRWPQQFKHNQRATRPTQTFLPR